MAQTQKIYLDDSGNPIQQKKVYLDDSGNPIDNVKSIKLVEPVEDNKLTIPDEMPELAKELNLIDRDPKLSKDRPTNSISDILNIANKSFLPETSQAKNFELKGSENPKEPDTYIQGLMKGIDDYLYDEIVRTSASPLGIGLTAAAGPIAKGALSLVRKIPGAAAIEQFLTKERNLFGKTSEVLPSEVLPPEIITDPRRLLPESTQKPTRFVAGESGVADVTKDYSTAFGGETIPIAPNLLAKHGAIPEVIPPIEQFFDTPVVRSGAITSLPGETLSSKVPSMRSVNPNNIDVPSRTADYGIRNTGTNTPPVPGHVVAGTNQQVFDALLPSRTKELIGMNKISPATTEIEQNIEMVRGSKPIENPIPKTPSIINIKNREAVTPKPLAKAVESDIPEIANAAKQVIDERAKDKSLIRRATDPYIKSGLSVLDDDSPAGQNISKLVQQTRNEGEQLAGGWSNQFKKITSGLNKEEWDNFVVAAEGKIAPINPKVSKALEDYRILDNEVTTAAEQSGMVMTDYNDKIVPFKPRDEYWPRIYPKNFVDSKKTDIFDELIKAGNSPAEAEKIIENSAKFGNRLISPQHARKIHIPGYRTDREAYLLHLDQMGKRITESKNFGPQDLGDKTSPLSSLVNQTRDKRYVTEILERHLGRIRPTNQATDTVVGKMNSLAAMTDLGLFTISNQAQKAVIPIRGDLKAFAKALTQFKTAAGKDFAEQSGALQTALRDSIADLGGEHWVSRLYRTGASERSNRTLASLTGKFTAQADFARLQKNPTDTSALQRLSDLLMASPEDILQLAGSQPFLDEKQLLTAGARMSEITQGRAGTIDLPSAWRASPEAKLMSMYKGYAFRQTKSMKDAFLQNPKKMITIGLPLLALTGEAVGDIKAGIRGGLSNDKTATEEIANRGKDNMVDKILKSANTPEKQRWLASRIAEDLSEAWMLGILGDLIGSAGQNPTGLIKFIAGPVAGMAADIGYGAVKSIKDLSLKPVASHAVKTLVPTPFGYPASQSEIFKKNVEESGRRR